MVGLEIEHFAILLGKMIKNLDDKFLFKTRL